MNTYRSLSVIKAVQYTGSAIPDVTCSGSDQEYRERGCDTSRRYHPHVHTVQTSGITVLKTGDWIYPVFGGPFAVVSDEKFRTGFEVPPPAEPPQVQLPAVEQTVSLLEAETPVSTPEVPEAFNSAALSPADPGDIISDLAKIDGILAEAKDSAN